VRRLIPLFVLPLLALGLFAVPASAAATINSFTVDGEAATTVETGDTVELAWDVTTELNEVEASTAGPDDVGFDGAYDPISNEQLTLTEPGQYTFTITATEEEGGTATASVTVTVVEPAPPIVVEPAPITFPDSCTVVIPASTGDNAGTQYGYGTGASGSGLDAGTYDLADLAGAGTELTFGAFPLEGYEFPDDTDTVEVVTAPASCFGAADDDGSSGAAAPTVAPAAGIAG
jgi:hypothetical protein